MSNLPYFEVFKDVSGQYRFRLKATNGQIVATGEAYTTKQNCIDAANWVRKNAPIAEIRDITGGR